MVVVVVVVFKCSVLCLSVKIISLRRCCVVVLVVVVVFDFILVSSMKHADTRAGSFIKT